MRERVLEVPNPGFRLVPGSSRQNAGLFRVLQHQFPLTAELLVEGTASTARRASGAAAGTHWPAGS